MNRTTCDVCNKQFVNLLQHKTKIHQKYKVVVNMDEKTIRVSKGNVLLHTGDYDSLGSGKDGEFLEFCFLDGKKGYTLWVYLETRETKWMWWWATKGCETHPAYESMFELEFDA